MANVAAAGVAQEQIRPRPLWMVAALTFLSQAAYEFWWYGRTWWELKRARNDPSMHPVWHALAMYVPIYGLFRLHAHFRTLNEVAAGAQVTERADPMLMVLLAIARGAIGIVAASLAAPAVIEQVLTAARTGIPAVGVTLPQGVALAVLLGFAIAAWQLYRGQQVLNAYYRSVASATAPRVLALEWIFLILFALRFLADFSAYARP